jgi:hypothetical protein
MCLWQKTNYQLYEMSRTADSITQILLPNMRRSDHERDAALQGQIRPEAGLVS